MLIVNMTTNVKGSVFLFFFFVFFFDIKQIHYTDEEANLYS